MKKMINRENTYYTIQGDDLFRCCGEYQDREYCVTHDKFQGCAFCSGFAYWESCDKGIVCEQDTQNAFDEMFADSLTALSNLTIIK
jgi:hypothetical protein